MRLFQAGSLHKWLDLHGRLVDEYHRTREITGLETVGQYWKRERK